MCQEDGWGCGGLAAASPHPEGRGQDTAGRHIWAISLTSLYCSLFIFYHGLWQESHKVLCSFCKVKVSWPSVILERRNIIFEGMFIISVNSLFFMPSEQFFCMYLDDSSILLARFPDQALPAKCFWSCSGKQTNINSWAEQIIARKLLISFKSLYCFHNIPESNAVSSSAITTLKHCIFLIKNKIALWSQESHFQNSWWWLSGSLIVLLMFPRNQVSPFFHDCTRSSVQPLDRQLPHLFSLAQSSTDGRRALSQNKSVLKSEHSTSAIYTFNHHRLCKCTVLKCSF